MKVYKIFVFNGDCYDIRFCDADETIREKGEYIDVCVFDDPVLAHDVCKALNEAVRREREG